MKDLKSKVPEYGGVDPEEAFLKAEKVIEELKEEYLDKLADDIRELQKVATLFRQNPDSSSLSKIYHIIHNMRGQAAAFDFPLISQIGGSFCKYVGKERNPENLSVELLLQHIEALKVVFGEQLKGDGNKVAQAVVKGLEIACHKIQAKDKQAQTQ